MSNANATDKFITGFFSILAIDFSILLTGMFVLSFVMRGDFFKLFSMFLIILIGLYQYIYVIPIIIWQLIKRKYMLACGFVCGSLLVLSIAIVVGNSLEHQPSI